MSLSYDVIIIGAGAAGLAAADVLARAGRSVRVLEARDRVGGRCWTLNDPGLAVPVELGAEFIHGPGRAALVLLARAGMAAVDRTGEGWHAERGKLHPMGEIFSEVRAAILAARPPSPDVSFEKFLGRELRHLSRRGRIFARRRVEGYDAADPARVSARAIIREWSGEDETTAASHFRPLGGYGPVLEWLARSLAPGRVRLDLGTAVTAVQWRRGRVEVEAVCGGRSLRVTAKRAIVTLPLGVLQLARGVPGHVRFAPALKEKRAVLRRLAPSPVIKVALRFRSAFWEAANGGRYAGAAFIRAPGAPFPSFWTALPVRAPLLIAWAGGPRATRLSGSGAPEIIRRAEQSLAAIFGRRIPGPESAYVHDWQEDPYARGAYSYVTVGGAGARRDLAAPVQGTLYFAGEAADFEGEHGTVAGALQSGIRAARRLLKSEK